MINEPRSFVDLPLTHASTALLSSLMLLGVNAGEKATPVRARSLVEVGKRMSNMFQIDYC